VTKFFDKAFVRKKTVTASKGTKRKRNTRGPLHEPVSTLQSQGAELVDQEEVLLEEAGNTLDNEELELADTQACEARESVAAHEVDDTDRAAHDNALVKGLSAVAITQMEDRGVRISPCQADDASKVLPKVCYSFGSSLCVID
jgi:hypothetical protein